MADKKKQIDWSAIRADWEKTDRSIRKLAEWYQVSDRAIRKKAQADGWAERPANPAAKVRTSSQGADQPPKPAEIDPTDPEQIVSRGQNLILRLLDELDATTANAETIGELIEINVEDPRSRAAMEKAVSLPSRAGVVKALAQAFKTWGEAQTAAPEGKKAQRQAAAEAVAASGNKFAPRSGPRLAVSNG